ncbi:hypothetical protein [Lapidilactobacillus bayanensis]|uniref:hypothetical protein n=1 Tax=Lapidilactobacillus bayanensis TaxID=2485998 RepID=UPI000F76BCF6|nr:hypothetical protein [Lapidilactobacillus bayanensis]
MKPMQSKQILTKVDGSITLLTLMIMTFCVLVIGYAHSYYRQKNDNLQNQYYYYEQQNQQLRKLVETSLKKD